MEKNFKQPKCVPVLLQIRPFYLSQSSLLPITSIAPSIKIFKVFWLYSTCSQRHFSDSFWKLRRVLPPTYLTTKFHIRLCAVIPDWRLCKLENSSLFSQKSVAMYNTIQILFTMNIDMFISPSLDTVFKLCSCKYQLYCLLIKINSSLVFFTNSNCSMKFDKTIQIIYFIIKYPIFYLFLLFYQKWLQKWPAAHKCMFLILILLKRN